MKALLLAAGLGTRLKPLTDVLPKCLAPIRGRPLMEYWLDLLGRGGCEKIVVNTHYHAPLVTEYIGGGPWSGVVEVAYEPELLGTGGTLRRHAAALRDGPFLLIHADNLSAFDLGAFKAAHAARAPGVLMTMMTFVAPDPRLCGIVETDEQGVVRAFHEKVANPPGRMANGAVFICEPEVLEVCAALGDVRDLSLDLIPHLLGRIGTWLNDDFHRDIGNLQAWRDAQTEYRGPVPAPRQPDSWATLLKAHPEIAATVERLLSGAAE